MKPGFPCKTDLSLSLIYLSVSFFSSALSLLFIYPWATIDTQPFPADIDSGLSPVFFLSHNFSFHCCSIKPFLTQSLPLLAIFSNPHRLYNFSAIPVIFLFHKHPCPRKFFYSHKPLRLPLLLFQLNSPKYLLHYHS